MSYPQAVDEKISMMNDQGFRFLKDFWYSGVELFQTLLSKRFQRGNR
jgi:hypothetical protein